MSQLGMYRSGRFSAQGHEFVLIESGMGFDNAARAAEALVGDSRPDLLISTGLCGAITPELQVGDVVVAESIFIAADNEREEVPALFASLGRSFVVQQAGAEQRVVAGTFVSTPVIRTKRGLAETLAGAYPHPVVEMESGAVAIVAAENHIPLLALRSVSDTAAEELGFSLAEFCSADMRRIRPYNVLVKVLQNPRIIPQLVRLSRSSRRAAASLTVVMSRVISRL
jgi:adenosylhomocysteine nucleosidase